MSLRPDFMLNSVVIGGGNIGADVARTAARLGAGSVSLYCLESYDEMPMGQEDRTECEEDGVTIHAGWGGQTEIISENGECKGIKSRKCVSVRDGAGRFKPVFDDNETTTASCDTVLYCIGQKTDWGSLAHGTGLTFDSRGLCCGVSIVDENRCIGCGLCTTRCEFYAIHLYRERPECSRMVPTEDKYKEIAKYAVKREIKILRNKSKRKSY